MSLRGSIVYGGGIDLADMTDNV